MADEKPRVITRREILKGAGVAAAAVSGAVAAPSTVAPSTVAPSAPAHAAAQRATPLEALTAQEADLLDLITARLIPSDALGPGAREAQAVRYIDRALAGALASSRDAYRSGLA